MRAYNVFIKFVLFTGLFTISVYAMGECNMETKNGPLLSSGSEYMLSKEEIEFLSKSALSGNAEAAFRLYQYFRFSRSDDEKATYWVGVAAKNGSNVGQYNFAVRLERKGSLKEALYWANILKSQNYPDIDDLINSIKEKMKENTGK